MITSWLTGLDKYLAGKGDAYLSMALVALAMLLLWLAYAAPPAWKAIALSWVVLP